MTQEQAEEAVCEIFIRAAYIANAMVHAPTQAPAAFQGVVKQWREQNLGEGEADAERAAAKLAEARAAFLDGRFEATLPDYVRERNAAAWKERREALENQRLCRIIGNDVTAPDRRRLVSACRLTICG